MEEKQTRNSMMIRDSAGGAYFLWRIVWLELQRVAIVIDLDLEWSTSVTNAIDSVADHLFVDHIVYRDSMGVWDYWSRDHGFGSLSHIPSGGEDFVPTKDLKTAIGVARKKYLDPIRREMGSPYDPD